MPASTTQTQSPPSAAIPGDPVETPPPGDGGTLHLSMRAPLTLNPLFNEDATVADVLKLLFEPLAVLDEQLKPADNLVSLNFSSDNTSVTLILRNDAIWNDGAPVTADDIIFSIDTLRTAPEAAIYKHNVDNIGICEKLDDKTVKITFVEVFGGSGYLLNFPIIPRHYYNGEKNPSSAKNMAPLGNGLFIFDAYTPLKSMELRQSPYTFRQPAYIERVEVLVIPDAETELHAFDQGLIDVIPLSMTEWSKHQNVKQTRYGEYDAGLYEFIGFNANNELLRDKRVRQAITLSLDADTLVPSIYLSHAVRTSAPVNPASWVYDASTPVYAYDREAAKVIMEEVLQTETGGEEVSGSESSEETHAAVKPILRILTNEENAERIKITEALAEALWELGLEPLLVYMPFEQFSQALSGGDYDLFVGGYRFSLIPDLRFAFHSNSILSGTNILAYRDTTLDRMLSVAFSAATENAYIKSLSDVQRRIAEELPVVSLAFQKSAIITDIRIQGDIRPSADNIFANVNEWYIP
jgi:peptide/nickel transport system substrate-binding protein